jgi:hypothetical protein
MATAGQLKAKIDLLKKKIAEKGTGLEPGRRRLMAKRLRRMQRRRRVLQRLEARHGKDAAGKGKGTGAAEGAAPPAPAAS